MLSLPLALLQQQTSICIEMRAAAPVFSKFIFTSSFEKTEVGRHWKVV
jgi:hypothetical protein